MRRKRETMKELVKSAWKPTLIAVLVGAALLMLLSFIACCGLLGLGMVQ